MEPTPNEEPRLEYNLPAPVTAEEGFVHRALLRHPYLFALGALAALLIVGMLLVARNAPVALSPAQHITWGGAGTVIAPTANTGSPQKASPSPLQQQPPYTYTIPTLSPATNGEDTTASSAYDYEAFIAALSQQNHPATTSTSASGSTDAYAFIPTGFISTATPQKRTKLQQAIYDYGNATGALIQAFEQEHPNTTQLLTDQIQDRTDQGKASAVERLGSALSALGDSLLAIDSVPTQFSDAHKSVATSYQDMGRKLALVPQAQGDQAYLDAINTYNSAAEVFVRNYVTLAQLFVANGVSFSTGDPGSVFTFTNATGL